jgi:hypothetical protein
LTRDGLVRLKGADTPALRTLFIRSGGGEVGVSMEFGGWVHSRGLEVVVVDFCASSCANYVFPAGQSKRVLPGGVVAWHGNAHQLSATDGLDEMIERMHLSQDAAADERAKKLAYLAAMRANEDAFFASIGVSECICRVGNERLGARDFYSMSAADMRRFGIDGIAAAPAREEDIADELRTSLQLSFVTIPEDLDVRRACR